KSDINGSGMHIHMNLKDKNGKNIFEDKSDSLGLSKEAYYFVGGLMKHIKGMAAITNPLVNSYKRLIPGFEAPVYIAWSATNRSPLIRIPSDGGERTRIELRSPDSAANPYLTLAVCLSAGLDGIANKIEPPKCVSGNIFAMTAEERREKNIDSLPASLPEAIEELEKDSFICDVLGKHIAERYIAAKKEEWCKYRSQVSEWELGEYLYKY
ncbi:MAG: glutamine synthetase family protein, partial [Acetatifactor sp.]